MENVPSGFWINGFATVLLPGFQPQHELKPEVAVPSSNMMTMATISNQNGAFPLLRKTELRRLLTEQQLQQLEQFCRASSKRAGSTLFRQGDPADTFHLLADGMVELRARPPGRRVYRTVELIGPSCTFG